MSDSGLPQGERSRHGSMRRFTSIDSQPDDEPTEPDEPIKGRTDLDFNSGGEILGNYMAVGSFIAAAGNQGVGGQATAQQVTPETHALNTDPNTQWQPMQDSQSWELDPIQELCTMDAYDDDPETDLCSNLLWPLSSRGAVMHTRTDKAVDLNYVDSFANFNCASMASSSDSLQDFQSSSSYTSADMLTEPLVTNSSATESARSNLRTELHTQELMIQPFNVPAGAATFTRSTCTSAHIQRSPPSPTPPPSLPPPPPPRSPPPEWSNPLNDASSSPVQKTNIVSTRRTLQAPAIVFDNAKPAQGARLQQAKSQVLIDSVLKPHICLHLHKSRAQAARDIGCGVTHFKKLCRNANILKWPNRQVQSLAATVPIICTRN
jgi:hypothetical protein